VTSGSLGLSFEEEERMTQRNETVEWKRLERHATQLRTQHIRDLFAADPTRHSRLSVEALDLFYDYSRQRLTPDVMTALTELARACELEARIAELFGGAIVNPSERRPALHMALRNTSGRPMYASGQNVMPGVLAELERVCAFVSGVHEGRIVGATRARFTDVVNIGIGGSDLGIVMATEALARYRNRAIRLHCVSNIDGTDLADTLEKVDASRTLFVVCSKTFTTLETLTNATSAREWLVAELGAEAVPKHFVAVSTNHAAMDAFGVSPEARFTIWDWVGGRYSLWSAVGLSIALALGVEPFRQLLQGGHDIDEHFRDTPLECNLPVLMGLIAVWNQNFLDRTSLAVLPYDRRLHRFPAYLQQLEMESNGKSVTRHGQEVAYATGVPVWGEPGNNAQHSFFQLLHQGNSAVAIDLLAPINGSSRFQRQQDLSLANCFAQAEALAYGQSAAEVAGTLAGRDIAEPEVRQLVAQKVHPGDRPTSLILFPRLDARTLGRLIAWYEHKVFVQSVIWDINPFDQWGVELGKKLATSLTPAVQAGSDPAAPARVRALLERVRRWRGH
jgi:glucose-6-phosphate isomerase